MTTAAVLFVFVVQSDDKFGFIIMDGNGTLFGTLSGNTREIIHKVIHTAL